MITCYHSLYSFEKPRNNCLKPSLFAVAGRSTKLYLREGGEDDSTLWLQMAKTRQNEFIASHGTYLQLPLQQWIAGNVYLLVLTAER